MTVVAKEDAPQFSGHVGGEQGEKRLWVVRFDVYIKHGGDKKKPKRHIRHLIVMAANDEEAEQMARQEATSFVFGPRIAAIEWRSTCSRPPVVDMTAWALARHEPGRAF